MEASKSSRFALGPNRTFRGKKDLPQPKAGEHSLKGPIPLDWLGRVVTRQGPQAALVPRIIRLRDAPGDFGMDRNRFNADVRPFLTEIPIGVQGIGFDRLELDAWVENYVARNGRPARKGVGVWDAKRHRVFVKRGGVWHIDKRLYGRHICQSTGTAQIEEAERYLARLMEQRRQAEIYGVRPSRAFEEAAAKFVLENQHKRSLNDDINRLKGLMPWIGTVPLDRLHMGTLRPWIAHRRKEGVSHGTINHGLQVVRHILNLAAADWVDEQGLTWIQPPPRSSF
jgi:hypothetical protein